MKQTPENIKDGVTQAWEKAGQAVLARDGMVEEIEIKVPVIKDQDYDEDIVHELFAYCFPNDNQGMDISGKIDRLNEYKKRGKRRMESPLRPIDNAFYFVNTFVRALASDNNNQK
jgi:hypothetical protein